MNTDIKYKISIYNLRVNSIIKYDYNQRVGILLINFSMAQLFLLCKLEGIIF